MSLGVRRRGAAAFVDRVEAFASSVRTAHERTAKLLGPKAVLEHDAAVLQELRDTLRVQQEVLLVAERQLRAQLTAIDKLGAQLDAERERSTHLLERAVDACLVTDRLGVVREANLPAARLLSLDVGLLCGKPMSALLDSDELRQMQDILAVLERGAPDALELELALRQGSSNDVLLTVQVSLTWRGRRLLWILRPSERSVRVPHDESDPALARALRDKEDLLLRERRAREHLELANRAKDRFIAVLSHDLRAPLNAIVGWTQILRREVMDSAARSRAFETIERNARMQARLIEELLDVSRMTEGRVQLALAPVDLGRLARHVVDGLLPRAVESGIDLSCDAEPDLFVVADAQRLEQVLMNLLSNALKYTPSGGSIVVDVRGSGNDVELLVRDTGKGIAPELIGHVFEMYTQERTYASARSGLGLGLHIVKHLVELHGGKVTAESAGEGHGATFTVLLPVREELVVVPPDEHSVRRPVHTLRGLHVLVVDDEEDSRELIATILRRAGADVASAAGGCSALELLGKWSPDVVVSDLAMPGGDGCELVSQLRQRNAPVATIAVSGFTGDEDSTRALEAGFDVYMSKPIDATALVEAVHEAARLRHR